MADIFSKEKRSIIMGRIKAKDTKPELLLRKGLWAAGLRYRKHVRSLRGTPDLAIKKYRMVIFVDSCFWHGCPKHFRMPKTNKDFWENKIKTNKKRDMESKRKVGFKPN